MKPIATALLAIFAVGMTAPAIAQEAPTAPPAAQAAAAKAGDTVYDTAGEVVGTVESVEGQNAVISTGTNNAFPEMRESTTTGPLTGAAGSARSDTTP